MKSKKEATKSNKTKRPTPQDYERVGRMIEAVVSTGYVNKKRLIGASLLRGVFFGLGTTLGATIVFAIVIATVRFLFNETFLQDLF